MSFRTDGKYVKIWKIFTPRTKDAKSVFMSVGTSEKNRNDEYENSSWSAVAVGHAFQQWKAGEIIENENYSIHGKLTNIRQQDDDGDWVDNYRLTIFDFGKAGEDANKDSSANPAKKDGTKKTASKKTAAKSNTKPVADEESDPW